MTSALHKNRSLSDISLVVIDHELDTAKMPPERGQVGGMYGSAKPK